MWTELCPEELLDLRLWPTGIAPADVLHSGVAASGSSLRARLDGFEEELRDAGIDLAAQRRARWMALADGDEALADDLATLATACTPATWYLRHAHVPDQLLDQPFDRFVDSLDPWASASSRDARVRAAAARLTERLADTLDARLTEVAQVAERVTLGGDEPVDLLGEIVVHHTAS